MSQSDRMHVALNVADLGRSIDFYRSVLGREPAKVRRDYAKFELDSPPLVLSLNPGAAPGGERQRLSHLGIRLAERASLEGARERLRAAGLLAREEREVECCYAVQDKLWVEDPDGNAWELYLLLDDAPTPSAERCPPSSCCA